MRGWKDVFGRTTDHRVSCFPFRIVIFGNGVIVVFQFFMFE